MHIYIYTYTYYVYSYYVYTYIYTHRVLTPPPFWLKHIYMRIRDKARPLL